MSLEYMTSWLGDEEERQGHVICIIQSTLYYYTWGKHFKDDEKPILVLKIIKISILKVQHTNPN